MPFKSKAQQRACYAKKARGEAGSWNCSEWSESTNFKKLPEKVSAVRDACICLNKLAEDLPPQAVVRRSALHKVASDLQTGVPLVIALRRHYPALTEKQAQDAAQAICRRVVHMRKQARRSPHDEIIGSVLRIAPLYTAIRAAQGAGIAPAGRRLEGAAKSGIGAASAAAGAGLGATGALQLFDYLAPGTTHDYPNASVLGALGTGGVLGGIGGAGLSHLLLGAPPDRTSMEEDTNKKAGVIDPGSQASELSQAESAVKPPVGGKGITASLGMPSSPSAGPTTSVLRPAATGENQPQVSFTTQLSKQNNPHAPMSTVSGPATNLRI